MNDSSTSLSDATAQRPTQEADTASGPLDEILLPVGPSDEARVEALVETTAEAAGLMQASVHVLHVFTPPRFEAAHRHLHDDPDDQPDLDALAQRVTPVRDVMHGLRQPLRDWGVTMDVDGRVSNAVATAIVHVADEIDAKRIVVGGRRRTPTGKAVFGSTAQEILLDAPCPVTFVRDP